MKRFYMFEFENGDTIATEFNEDLDVAKREACTMLNLPPRMIDTIKVLPDRRTWQKVCGNDRRK